MKKLLNISDFPNDDENLRMMEKYQKKYNFDGFEIIKFDLEKDSSKLKDKIIGYHMRFFPMWLDIYLGKYNMIKEKFSDKMDRFYWCGGDTKEDVITYYKKDLQRAKELGVEYVVFHACYVDDDGSLTYQFPYTDKEVLEGVVSLINDVFKNEDFQFTLLLENLWWAGLKLNSKSEMKLLLNKIEYKNIGFILDTSHMLNTNFNLKNLDEGIDYIIENIDKMEELKQYIYGVHLSWSLSGDYVSKMIKKHRKSQKEREKAKKKIYEYVGQIDYHYPFEDNRIMKVLNKLSLKWLVYEFLYYNDEELEEKVIKQEKIFS
ncbi:TIM barrel protein [uncultured Fusobacterium sp.]|uniref:TIM barrel protein n=1 Tax=uncultured Fusobacterium sp. TaxID=159267 RepID=UPI0025E5A48B|nr:TIM barrel protein [uncultured Fusobacterium sp.]